ncbi:hypothetical protein BJY01DRAFT_208493 [Aspergillus pseudoustus]|uniref:Uncharacterized protein n=1 Tax=Aspergillus pseudoustus TaxID=1810923 RepID=A0ABR4KIM2_9EURO
MYMNANHIVCHGAIISLFACGLIQSIMDGAFVNKDMREQRVYPGVNIMDPRGHVDILRTQGTWLRTSNRKPSSPSLGSQS